MENNWIKVEDRLPELTGTSSDWVLTFDKEYDGLDVAFYSSVMGWQAQHGDKMFVTHWMPLPEPPKNT